MPRTATVSVPILASEGSDHDEDDDRVLVSWPCHRYNFPILTTLRIPHCNITDYATKRLFRQADSTERITKTTKLLERVPLVTTTECGTTYV